MTGGYGTLLTGQTSTRPTSRERTSKEPTSKYTVNFHPAVEAEMWALTEGEQPVESADARPSDMKTSQAQTQDTPT